MCMYACTYVYLFVGLFVYLSRVSNQNGVSLLYIMLEMHHSCREPSNYYFFFFFFVRHTAMATRPEGEKKLTLT